MKRLPKYLHIPLRILMFPLYFMFTWKERDNYMVGMQKGKRVIWREEYQTGTKFIFHPTEKPVRDYKTFSEYLKY